MTTDDKNQNEAGINSNILDHDVVDYCLIESDATFQNGIEQWLKEPFLAIDTEFMRTDSYFAKPGLIQISDAKTVYIIDPLTLTSLKPLAKILENEDIVKVLHAMSEDIDLLFNVTSVQPKNIFDTQIAAAFLAYGPSLSYQALVSEVLDIELDKSETRSDWLKRPLTLSQLSYAAKDVEYLALLFKQLEKELIEANLYDAVFDEVNSVIEQTFETWHKPEDNYLKLRGAWELAETSQRLLQALVVWRDELAKEIDVPKPWIFSDALLIQAAQNKPVNLDELKHFKGIQFKSLKRYGQALIDTVLNFEDVAVSESSFVGIEAPVKGNEMLLFKKAKKVVAEVAQKSGIAAQLLGSRKMLEALVIHIYRHKNTELPLAYQGWRRDLVGSRLLDILCVDSD